MKSTKTKNVLILVILLVGLGATTFLCVKEFTLYQKQKSANSGLQQTLDEAQKNFDSVKEQNTALSSSKVNVFDFVSVSKRLSKLKNSSLVSLTPQAYDRVSLAYLDIATLTDLSEVQSMSSAVDACTYTLKYKSLSKALLELNKLKLIYSAQVVSMDEKQIVLTVSFLHVSENASDTSTVDPVETTLEQPIEIGGEN